MKIIRQGMCGDFPESVTYDQILEWAQEAINNHTENPLITITGKKIITGFATIDGYKTKVIVVLNINGDGSYDYRYAYPVFE